MVNTYWKRVLSSIFAALVLLLLHNRAGADEPSLEVTRDWLVSTLNGMTTSMRFIDNADNDVMLASTSTYYVKARECGLEVTIERESYGYKDPLKHTSAKIPLAFVLGRYVVKPYSGISPGINNRMEPREIWTITDTPILFEDRSLAERVSTALRHAAGLCGKKSEPF